MKKLITLIAFALIASSAQAEWDMFKGNDHNKDGKVTKEEWLAQRQKTAEKQNKKYNEKQSVKTFEKADTDGDGSLSREEMEALQANWKKN